MRCVFVRRGTVLDENYFNVPDNKFKTSVQNFTKDSVYILSLFDLCRFKFNDQSPLSSGSLHMVAR